MAAGKREGCFGMVNRGGVPVVGGMARGAVGALRPVMSVVGLVAGITVGGCTLVDFIGMAGSAASGCVSAVQFKSSFGMIDLGIAPLNTVMAVSAFAPQSALMDVVGRMA